MKTIRAFRRLAIPCTLFVALFAVLALAVSPLALADHDDRAEASALLQQGKILPLSRILAVVQQQVPGDVVEVELDHDKRGWDYKVKVLTASGHVRKMRLNASDGTILKIKDD